MSLPVAERGAKEHLRTLWESASFDFAVACRRHGRNDAFWALCYWTTLSGLPLPDEKQRRRLVREANRATGGVNQVGERERYTNYEAQATIEQVARYGRAEGVKPMLRARRHWAATSRSRYATTPARRLLNAICDLASACGRIEEIRASHRQLAERAGLHPTEVASLLYSLQAAGQVFRLGFTPCYQGRPRGTTRLSLKPPEPTDQRIDEAERPAWDALQARWSWSTPLARGTITQQRYRWLTRPWPRQAASVPYVYGSLPTSSTSYASAFYDVSQASIETVSSRGSP